MYPIALRPVDVGVAVGLVAQVGEPDVLCGRPDPAVAALVRHLDDQLVAGDGQVAVEVEAAGGSSVCSVILKYVCFALFSALIIANIHSFQREKLLFSA